MELLHVVFEKCLSPGRVRSYVVQQLHQVAQSKILDPKTVRIEGFANARKNDGPPEGGQLSLAIDRGIICACRDLFVDAASREGQKSTQWLR